MNRKFINVLLIFAISVIAISLLTSVKAAGLKPGDVDGNGVITKHDANLVLTMIGNNTNKKIKADKKSVKQVAADFDGNGLISIADVTKILKNVECNLGDINGDDKITIADAKLVLKIVAGTVECDDKQIANADVNGDGKVTVLESNIIMRKIANMNFVDINGDGKISIADAKAIKCYVDGTKTLTPVQLFNADINNDGKITDKDVLLYLNYINKK